MHSRGFSGTAPIDQRCELAPVHDIVTDEAPAFVLPAPMMPLLPVPVCVCHCWVCPLPAASGLAGPGNATTSTTSSPGALGMVSEAAVPLEWSDTNVPNGVPWFTPVNDAAPPTTSTDVRRLTRVTLML